MPLMTRAAVESSSVSQLNSISLGGERQAGQLARRCPYHLSHQVELLHLQAEADALLIKVQNLQRQRELA